ncbi:MAG: PhoH family protein [Eubacteriales bacterium]|nr:PhoH family protein [Eubacteriales bacterium]MDD3882538.1 PhoH family protein [Eubacteriales bacterium]MDD4512838.1 PhoH family protein [Eubacteriales bacterium]
MEAYSALFGAGDRNIALIEQETGTAIALRADRVEISGSENDVLIARDVLEKLMELSASGEETDRTRIRYALELRRSGRLEDMDELLSDVVAVTYRGKPIKAKTLGQRNYVDMMRRNQLTFAVGPAGTGKTYLAIAMAVMALKNREVERIVLTRPAVEAGEKLGFLPGDLTQKVDPYLRPLYDALYDMMGVDSYQKLFERGTVEIAPLAYMRGRTLSECFVILDEAQNTTPEQMKMFLTRFGAGSRAVVTGDLTQVDLPMFKKSGLADAVEVLSGVEGIAVSMLKEGDVVRNELVQRIVRAYANRPLQAQKPQTGEADQ